MFKHLRYYVIITLLSSLIFIYSCESKHAATEPQIVEKPEEMDEHVSDNIKDVLQYAYDNDGKINDEIKLHATSFVDSFYQQKNYTNVWSKNAVWESMADSLFNFITHSEIYGLFPADFHFANLINLRNKIENDSLAKADANIWTQADIILTDAFMQLTKQLKWGRLLPDSISLITYSTFKNDFFTKNLNAVLEKKNLTSILNSLEPENPGYIQIKKGIKRFVDSMDRSTYTYIAYQTKDSLLFIKKLKQRLIEGAHLDTSLLQIDSLQLAEGIKSFQKKRNLKINGKISSTLISQLNNNDSERFKKIAINLDRYKQLPDKLPQKYIWVNIPGYYLQVWDGDTVALESKVIVGKTNTRTPLLNSQITDMITYPKWTIPNSIIK